MDIPIVCDLNAISSEERADHVRLAQSLFYEGRGEVRELENGYSFYFQPETITLLELARYVANERLCCPFWDFTIGVEAENGPMWMRLIGPQGAKELIKAELQGKEIPSSELGTGPA